MAVMATKKVTPINKSNGFFDLEDRMKALVIGQDEAIEEICPVLAIYAAGFSPENQPAASFLLLGPTGTGKTRTPEALAECLHGDPKRLIRIDCGEFQGDHEVAKIIGAPPGYLGHRETEPAISAKTIIQASSEKSNLTVVVFDEIEKGSNALIRLLMGILDKAQLKLGDNTVVDMSRCIIFMTSNLGALEMKKQSDPDFGFRGFVPIPSTGKMNSIGSSSAKRRLPPEFINRLDAIITYKTLKPEHIDQILDLEIEKIEDQIAHAKVIPGFEISLSATARKHVLGLGFDKEYGARNLKRVLKKHVIHPLAICHDSIDIGSSAFFDVVDGELDLTIQN